MRILITGATGQLGRELCEVLAQESVVPKDLPAFDLTHPGIERELLDAQPEVIIHAGAYTDVDGAERDPERATAVNVTGTERVARAAAQLGARLVYVSTDYVFDGSQREPFREQHAPNPLNHYGWTKWRGEHAVLSSGARALVVRTAWLFSRHGKNFVTSIMRAAREQSVLHVVDDQHGCPTAAGDLARCLAALVQRDLTGVLHVVNSGSCTWHALAETIVKEMGLSTPVVPITTAQAGRLAKRPPYSVLNIDQLAGLGLTLPDWHEALRRVMRPEPSCSPGPRIDSCP